MKLQAAKKGSSIILLTFLAASILPLLSQPVYAVSNVPVPQFTVRYIDDSYDVNTPSSIDPFTGANIPPTHYHIDHSYIQISFENNKLPAIPIDSHSEYYYNIRYKGQYTNNWIEARSASDDYYRASYFKTVNLSLGEISSSAREKLPVETKIDFQVQLMYGGIGKNLTEGPLGSLFFVGETSGWSSTQTITIGSSSSAITITPPSTQTQTIAPTAIPTTILPTQVPTTSLESRTKDAGFTIDLWQYATVVLGIVVILLVAVLLLQRKINR